MQLAAVLGREFTYELIQAVSPLDDADLAVHLEQLVTSEFLYRRGTSTESSYIFKHALIQDAAYNSLLISRRHDYHKQVAQVLKDRFTATVEGSPEVLAHHYTEAGLSDRAVPEWSAAARRALQNSALAETVAHASTGLRLLASLP